MATERVVVVLGKTGAGKSTVANKILGPNSKDYFEVATSFTSTKTEAKSISNDGLQDPETKKTFNVKVIDTKGLFDTDEGEAGNMDILQSVKEFFLKEAPKGVNLILFVCKHGRWTEEEQKVFDYLSSNFEDVVHDYSALVFTGCEDQDKSCRERVVIDFTNDPTRRVIANLMGKGIYTVGFPDTSRSPSVLKSGYESVAKEDQKELHHLVYTCYDKCLSAEFIKQSFWEKLLCRKKKKSK